MQSFSYLNLPWHGPCQRTIYIRSTDSLSKVFAYNNTADIQKNHQARQQFTQQKNENEMVLKVHSACTMVTENVTMCRVSQDP